MAEPSLTIHDTPPATRPPGKLWIEFVGGALCGRVAEFDSDAEIPSRLRLLTVRGVRRPVREGYFLTTRRVKRTGWHETSDPVYRYVEAFELPAEPELSR